MLDQMPAHVLRVVQMCRGRWEAEAEERGYARGYEACEREILGGIRVMGKLRPDMASVPTVNPVDTFRPELVSLSEDADEDVSAELSAVPGDLEAELDDLFGDDRWSDLDRQELVRFVMAAVQESLAARGRDPAPVLEMLAKLGGGHKDAEGDGFEAAMAGGQQLSQWLSWQAVPLQNPRGDHRFKAVDGSTGNELYGHKADAVMRRKNRDAKYEFGAEGAEPPQDYDLPGAASIEDHTTAYRKARQHVDDLRERLNGDGPVRPGDLADFQAYLPLMRSQDLREIRRHLVTGLTKRIAGGKTKADRVANIKKALGRLKEAAVAISTAVLKRAEEAGYDISPVEEKQVEDEVAHDVLLAGEFGPEELAAPEEMDGEVRMDDMPTSASAQPVQKPMPVPSDPMASAPKQTVSSSESDPSSGM